MLAHQVEAQKFNRDALLHRQKQMAPRDRVKQRLAKHNHRSRLAQDNCRGAPHKSPASLQGLWLREDVKEAKAELGAQQLLLEDPHDGDSSEDQLARTKPSTGIMSPAEIQIGKPRKQKSRSQDALADDAAFVDNFLSLLTAFSGDFEFLRTPAVLALEEEDIVHQDHFDGDGDMEDDDWLCVDSDGIEGLPSDKLDKGSRPAPVAPNMVNCKPTFAEATKGEAL